MKMLNALIAASASGLISSTLLAKDITVDDPYARVLNKSSKSGAAFMNIHNHSSESDVLISITSNLAQKVELHTHQEIDGVMKMIKLTNGVVVPGLGHHEFKRGDVHIMFMGLTQSLQHGDEIPVTLIFERSGSINLTIPVDLERKEKVKHDH